MSHRKAILGAAILFAALCGSTSTHAEATVAGVWSGVVQGTQVRLVLDADGSGQLLGQPIRWATLG